MYEHHEESIANITAKLKGQSGVLAVLVCGSIAHRFETAESDIDIMIVVSDADYEAKASSAGLHYYDKESCTCETGYIDGKYTSLAQMERVAEEGSEPARYAFEGAWAPYSEIADLTALLQRIVMYPSARKNSNMSRFYAQLEAWKWYCGEAIKQQNAYLLNHSISNLILFSGRLILAHNEVLYPYHKWFLRVLSSVPQKPDGLIASINALLQSPTAECVSALYKTIVDFRQWTDSDEGWPNVFIRDSELNWMTGNVPVGDI